MLLFLSREFVNVVSLVFHISSAHINTEFTLDYRITLSLHAQLLKSKYSPISHVLSHLQLHVLGFQMQPLSEEL